METRRAPSLPLVAPPLGFPRYCAKGWLAPPWEKGNRTPLRDDVVFSGNRPGAKRRAAGAVSGEAAERPMEPEAFRASPCVFAVIADFLGYYWISPDEKVQCRPAGAGGQVEVCGEEDAEETTQAEDAGEGLGAAQVVAAVGGAGLDQGLREGMD